MENEDIDGDIITNDDPVQNTIGSDADFDDDLGVPESLLIDDVEGGNLEIIQQTNESNVLILTFYS